MIATVLSFLSSPAGILLGEVVKRKMQGEVMTKAKKAEARANSKGLVSSGTVHGIVVLVLGYAAAKGWLGIDPAAVPELATHIAVIGGAVWAIWRRMKAAKKIG